MDAYVTPDEKIALAIASAKVAKAVTVKEDGIGEDIPFCLLVWREETLTAIAQLDEALRDEQPGERLIRTVEAAAICRRGFDASAFTFVTEGFCATDPTLVDPDVPLAEQFVANQEVRECLTLTHLEAGNVYLAALPYRYDVGRVVLWDDDLRYEPTWPGSNQFLVSMSEILLRERFLPAPVDDPTWRDVVAEDVSRWGFHIHYGMEDD